MVHLGQYLVLAIFALHNTFGQSINTFKFKPIDEGESFVQLANDPGYDLPARFTLCSSHFLDKIRFVDSHIELLQENGTHWIFYYIHSYNYAEDELMTVWINIAGTYANLGAYGPLLLHTWYHICLAVDTQASMLDLAINGKTMKQNFFIKTIGTGKRPKNIKERILLGKYFEPGNGWVQTLLQVGNIQIFSKRLSAKEMQAATVAPCESRGDFFSWDRMRWETFGTVEEVNASFCSVEGAKLVSIPAYVNNKQALTTCENLRESKMLDLNGLTPSDIYKIFNSMIDPADLDKLCSNEIWLPYTDTAKEGDWINQVTNEKKDDILWGDGQPNGGEAQNCAKQVNPTVTNPIDDQPCLSKACFICKNANWPKLTLRGLCSTSNLDTLYFVLNENKSVTYSGWASTDISYDFAKDQFVATVRGKKTFATSKASFESLLLGSHTWTVYNDAKSCSPDKSYMTRLMLSSCNRLQFSCDDGSCVPMNYRCDGKSDCKDISDEKECKIVDIDDTYSKEINPPPIGTLLKTAVNISMNISSVLEIDEIKGFVFVKYVLITNWKDSRLTFHNLKRQEEMNIVTEDQKAEIWTPKLIFANTNDDDETITDDRAVLKIIPDTKFAFSAADLTSLDNINIFNGDLSSLEMTRSYSTKFICDYDMSWYPFDSQICFMNLVLKGNADDFITLFADQIHFRQNNKIELSLY